MNAATIAALSRINRKFYDSCEESFSATRSRPWKGWNRAIAPFLEGCATPTPGATGKRILDVGCGNGRFGVFLDRVLESPASYLGLDSGPRILRRARQNLAPLEHLRADLGECELSEDLVGQGVDTGPYDLVVVLGVLHHIPGLDRRQRLLEELAGLLSSAGVLILSFWQFGGDPRFRRRIVDWQRHNAVAEESIALGELERGDWLLAWGDGDSARHWKDDDLGPRRYCHHAEPDEAQRLVQSLGLALVDSFQEDGKSGDLNLYFVLQQSANFAAP